MTTHDKSALRRYYRQISSWLPCDGDQKKQIVHTVQDNVAAFLEDHPEADFPAIEQRFGSPKQIAAAFVESMDMPALLLALRNRRRVVTAVVAGVIAALLLWAGGVSIAVAEQHADNPSSFVDRMQ